MHISHHRTCAAAPATPNHGARSIIRCLSLGLRSSAGSCQSIPTINSITFHGSAFAGSLQSLLHRRQRLRPRLLLWCLRVLQFQRLLRLLLLHQILWLNRFPILAGPLTSHF